MEQKLEEAKRDLMALANMDLLDGYAKSLMVAVECIDKVKRKTGSWKWVEEHNTFRCTACGAEYFQYAKPNWEHCPKCGAEMPENEAKQN